MWTLRSMALPESFTVGKIKYRAVREGLLLGPTQRVPGAGMPRVGAALSGGQHPTYKMQRDRPPLQSHYENPQLLKMHDSFKSSSRRGGALKAGLPQVCSQGEGGTHLRRVP